MQEFDEIRLRAILAKLEDWQRATFIAACCERMIPNYRRFSVETRFGDFSVLRSALNAAWQSLPLNSSDSGDANDLEADVERQVPVTERFGSRLTSAALDAANAVAILVESRGKASVDAAIETAGLSRDTVDLYVQDEENLDPLDPNLESRILSHPLMQRELRCQADDLEFLKTWSGTRSACVSACRQQAESRPASLD